MCHQRRSLRIITHPPDLYTHIIRYAYALTENEIRLLIKTPKAFTLKRNILIWIHDKRSDDIETMDQYKRNVKSENKKTKIRRRRRKYNEKKIVKQTDCIERANSRFFNQYKTFWIDHFDRAVFFFFFFFCWCILYALTTHSQYFSLQEEKLYISHMMWNEKHKKTFYVTWCLNLLSIMWTYHTIYIFSCVYNIKPEIYVARMWLGDGGIIAMIFSFVIISFNLSLSQTKAY